METAHPTAMMTIAVAAAQSAVKLSSDHAEKFIQFGEPLLECDVLGNSIKEAFEPEAAIVRHIFDMYLNGKGLDQIADLLTRSGIPTRNEEIVWTRAAVAYIIRNEKYIGDSMLQKKYSTGQIPYTQKVNKGERTRYYLTDTHSAIIDRKSFEEANRLFAERSSQIPSPAHTENPLSRRIRCSHCGVPLKVKRHGSAVFWTCRNHDKNRAVCPITQIPDTVIKDAFLRLYYKLKHQGQPILAQVIKNLQSIRNHRMLWSLEVVELNKQISELTSQNQMLAELKQHGLIDPDIFISQANDLAEQLRAAKLAKEKLLDTENDQALFQTRQLLEIIDTGPDFLDTFDGELFGEIVDHIIVDSNDLLRFRLKNGLDLIEPIERTVR